MSRLNASTPRSTPGARIVDEEDNEVEFARKGFSVAVVGAKPGVEECSCDEDEDDFDVVRSGTRAITRQLQSSENQRVPCTKIMDFSIRPSVCQ